MTTLNERQYSLTWYGEFNGIQYAKPTYALVYSEQEAWDYLQGHVNNGWVVLETTLERIK